MGIKPAIRTKARKVRSWYSYASPYVIIGMFLFLLWHHNWRG